MQMKDPNDKLPQEDRGQLREYLAILGLRKWSIILVTLLVVGGAMLFSVRQTPMYTSEARVLVQQPAVSTGTSSPVAQFQVNLDTERELVTSAQVADLTARRLDGAVAPGQLLAGLHVDVIPKTEILLMRYQSPDPLESRQRAQAFALAYLDFRRQQAEEALLVAADSIQQRKQDLEKERTRAQGKADKLPEGDPNKAKFEQQVQQVTGQIALLDQQLAQLTVPENVRVGQVVQPASLPSAASSPDYVQNGVLALLLGLALGVGLAFLRERLDDRLRGRSDFEQAIGAPVLAVIPRVSSWRRKTDTPLITNQEPQSTSAEAYRTLRTSLLFAASQRDVKILIVASPHPGEGKTVTSCNLAVALAQAGKRVILVSADLRKPRLHRFFGLANDVGLTNVLIGEREPRAVVRDVGIENLKVVPSGAVPGNPAELLGSEAMGRFVTQLREVCDFVILDSAPVLAVSDALAVAPFADATLFLADAEVTTRGAVAQTRTQLEQVDSVVIGALLNNFDPSRARPYAYYGYGYYYAGYSYRLGASPGKKRRLRRGRAEPEPAGSGNGARAAPIKAVTGFEQRARTRRRAKAQASQPATEEETGQQGQDTTPGAEQAETDAIPSDLWDLYEEAPRASGQGDKGNDHR
jgi:polysaccharide biosynthesis transport protein